jgi:hypothetical protein
MGPAGALLDEKKADAAIRQAAQAAIREALPGIVTVAPDGGVRLEATIHLVTAVAA